jgi:hypothetical protein
MPSRKQKQLLPKRVFHTSDLRLPTERKILA